MHSYQLSGAFEVFIQTEINDMTVNLKSLMTNHNLRDGAILFICVCIVLGLIFIRPKSFGEIFFVPVRVSVLDEAFQKIQNIRAYGISPRNVIRMLEYRASNKAIDPIKKLILSIPKDNIKAFKQVRFSLGEKHFIYTHRQVLQNWKRVDKHFNEEKTIIDYISFEAPSEVKTDSILNKMAFIVPLTGLLINGNPKTLYIIKECSAIFYTPLLFAILLIVLVFTIPSSKYAVLNTNTFVSMILSKAHYNRQKRFAWAHIVLVFISTFTVASIFSRLGIDVHHQGFLFQSAVNISEGKILFKDIYFHYGPLTAILQSLAIDIFGKKLIAIQIETALFYALISIFLWLIWSRLMQPALATISCFIWLCLAAYLEDIFLPWSSVHALFFLTLSLYMAILALEKGKLRYLYLTGVTVSLTFWVRQPEGILLFLSMLSLFFILYLLQKSDVKVILKGIGVFLAGNVTVSIVFFTWLSMNGAVKDWWVQCFAGMAGWAFTSGGMGVAYKAVLAGKALFPDNYWTLFPLFAFLTLFSIIPNIVNKEKIDKQTGVLLAILFISLANWLNYFPTPCIKHCYWAATPLVGIFIFYLLCSWKLIVKLLRLRKIALPFGLALLMLLSITIVSHEIIKKIDYGIKRYTDYRYEVTKPDVLSGMMVVHKSQVAALKKLDMAIRTYLYNFPGTSLISLSNMNILFLTLVDNNKMFSPLQIPRMNSKFFSTIYKYEENLYKCIKEKKVLIFTEEPKSFSGYHELTHISTTPTLACDSGTWYLYAPNKDEKQVMM